MNITLFLCTLRRYWHRAVLSNAAAVWWMTCWTHTDPQMWIRMRSLPQITPTTLALKFIGVLHYCKSYNPPY